MYRRLAESVLRWKGDQQDIILVPFMWSPHEDRYCIKIQDPKKHDDVAMWRRINIEEWAEVGKGPQDSQGNPLSQSIFKK